MLESAMVKQVVGFVQAKPRSIQEIAHLLQKNWRTADRYVEQIATEQGSIATRIFREGTRGALKLVYYVNSERIASTEFQERLLQRILAGTKKFDFSPFDIYQYVAPDKRRAFVEMQDDENVRIAQDIIGMFRAAQQRIIIFSGNLSWANAKQGTTKIIDVLEEVAKAGIPIKIVSRVDIASLKNLALVQEINDKLGREAIEVRNAEQPLRCTIIDGTHARLKESKSPEQYKSGELEKKTHVFYDIYDVEWVEWLQKVFYLMFRAGMPASRRLEGISSIQQLSKTGHVMRRGK